MRQLLISTVIVLLLSFVGIPCQADLVCNVSGTFGADLPGNSMSTNVAGGSFTLTFETIGLPLGFGGFSPLESFSFSTFDSSGSLNYTFGDSTGADGFIIDDNNPPDITLAYFYDPQTVASLNLDFASGFNGTGAVIPTDSTTYLDNASIYFDTNGNAVMITSGYSFLSSVPEPSSFVLVSISGLLMQTYLARRGAKIDAEPKGHDGIPDADQQICPLQPPSSSHDIQRD